MHGFPFLSIWVWGRGSLLVCLGGGGEGGVHNMICMM